MARSGRDVVVVERNRQIGSEQSSRNSEVIHAGLYYPPGSLKARLCATGRRQLYAYARHRAVAHRAIGKLVVVTGEDEVALLASLADRARANGVRSLVWLDAVAVRRMEPALEVRAALWSPETGIIDSHALMAALLADLELAGGQLVLKSTVQQLAGADGGVRLVLDDGATVTAATVINAAGIHASPLLARSGLPSPEIRLVKGSYFSHAAPVPLRHLVYPLPDADGLGIHVTRDLAGGVRFGPDAEPVTTVDYQVNPDRRQSFARAIRRYYPALDENHLEPGYAGIRPRGPDGDFIIQTRDQHGVPGLVNLLGFDSPGLTCCLAIAAHVAAIVKSEK